MYLYSKIKFSTQIKQDEILMSLELNTTETRHLNLSGNGKSLILTFWTLTILFGLFYDNNAYDNNAYDNNAYDNNAYNTNVLVGSSVCVVSVHCPQISCIFINCATTSTWLKVFEVFIL
jgi:hypothetical protein